jgi:Tfp pilus assembly protein PilN
MKAVNLIPTEQRRVRATGDRSGSAYVLIGVLATLLVMVAAYVFTASNVTDRQNKAAAAKAEAKRLEAQAAQSDSFTNFAQIKQTRLVSVSSIADNRFDWERMMRELSRAMPAGSWLQASDASVAGQGAGGDTSTASTTTAAPAGPSANLTGCTPNQADVARMMVRLRQMHRVTDVVLNQSSTEVGESGEVTSDSCGSYYQFDVTVSFAVLQPETEAPRGETRVPASLGGGS